MISGGAEVMTVRHAAKADSVALRALDCFANGKRCRFISEATARIHDSRRAFAFDDLRLRLAVRAPFAQVLRIERHPRKPVRRKTFAFSRDECPRRGKRH